MRTETKSQGINILKWREETVGPEDVTGKSVHEVEEPRVVEGEPHRYASPFLCFSSLWSYLHGPLSRGRFGAGWKVSPGKEPRPQQNVRRKRKKKAEKMQARNKKESPVKDDTMGLTYMGPCIHRLFSINTCTVSDSWLGARGCGGPAVCIDLLHFIQSTWVSMDFGIQGVCVCVCVCVSWNQLSFGGVKS